MARRGREKAGPGSHEKMEEMSNRFTTKLLLVLFASFFNSQVSAQTSSSTSWRIATISSTCLVLSPEPSAPVCNSETRVYNVDDASFVYACFGSWFSFQTAPFVSCSKFTLPTTGSVNMAFAGQFTGPFQTTTDGTRNVDRDLSAFWTIGTGINSLRYCKLTSEKSCTKCNPIGALSCSGAPQL